MTRLAELAANVWAEYPTMLGEQLPLRDDVARVLVGIDWPTTTIDLLVSEGDPERPRRIAVTHAPVAWVDRLAKALGIPRDELTRDLGEVTGAV